jgi:hypothetical protein
VDRLEKSIWTPAGKRLEEQVDVYTPAGGGEVVAVTGPAYGPLQPQGMDLYQVLGVVWQGGERGVTAADLSRTASKTMGEIQTVWTRVDDDQVVITATDPGRRKNKRMLTLDRRFGYAVTEAREEWEGSKDYNLLKASDFADAGGGVMLPMTIETLHRGAGCTGDYDATKNTYRVKGWVLNDPKNTAEALKVSVPKGVKAVDRKPWYEAYNEAQAKRVKG